MTTETLLWVQSLNLTAVIELCPNLAKGSDTGHIVFELFSVLSSCQG